MTRINVFRLITALVLAAGVTAAAGCATTTTSQTATTQTARAQRGNLTTDIVAGGNLELAQKEDLAFQVAGTVAEILVDQEDAVEKGQVIARLDASVLAENVKTAERAVKNAEVDLADAETGDFKIKTAEYDLETATLNFNKLNYPYSAVTFNLYIPAAIEDLNAALQQINKAQEALEEGEITDTWATAVEKYNNAREKITTALEKLTLGQPLDTYSGTSISRVITDYQAARASQMTMEKAQYNLVQTKRSVQSTLDKATLALEKAQDDLKKAQDDLDSAVITAPFAGFITKVNVSGGEEIQKGTVAVQLADPSRFKTTIMVGETDVFKLSEGMEASVQIDSLPAVILNARVTQIAPTATIQSGVVNYEVEVEADSLPVAAAAPVTLIPSTGPGLTGTGGPEGKPSFNRGDTGLNPGNANTKLREGLTVTLNITVSGKKDILLIPGQAVQRSGKDIQVQVVKNGITSARTIKTGISNWQYTEVTEGLDEGEEVVIQAASAAATTTTGQNQRPPGGGQFFIPGAGGGAPR